MWTWVSACPTHWQRVFSPRSPRQSSPFSSQFHGASPSCSLCLWLPVLSCRRLRPSLPRRRVCAGAAAGPSRGRSERGHAVPGLRSAHGVQGNRLAQELPTSVTRGDVTEPGTLVVASRLCCPLRTQSQGQARVWRCRGDRGGAERDLGVGGVGEPVGQEGQSQLLHRGAGGSWRVFKLRLLESLRSLRVELQRSWLRSETRRCRHGTGAASATRAAAGLRDPGAAGTRCRAAESAGSEDQVTNNGRESAGCV